ncbi:hypothetical protein [Flavobacterium sp.]|uniref:hypothetical protein n=1 Tax=Flavobacterium sp. TaxID=239 RepID=UPI0031CDC46A
MGITHLGRMWAVHPEGMLQSNKLISKEQVTQIDNWLMDISYAAYCLLDELGQKKPSGIMITTLNNLKTRLMIPSSFYLLFLLKSCFS